MARPLTCFTHHPNLLNMQQNSKANFAPDQKLQQLIYRDATYGYTRNYPKLNCCFGFLHVWDLKAATVSKTGSFTGLFKCRFNSEFVESRHCGHKRE
jgi:hypothetical protein